MPYDTTKILDVCLDPKCFSVKAEARTAELERQRVLYNENTRAEILELTKTFDRIPEVMVREMILTLINDDRQLNAVVAERIGAAEPTDIPGALENISGIDLDRLFVWVWLALGLTPAEKWGRKSECAEVVFKKLTKAPSKAKAKKERTAGA